MGGEIVGRVISHLMIRGDARLSHHWVLGLV